jgi:ABC-type proline/glycine betaine transport system ATPase subunit
MEFPKDATTEDKQFLKQCYLDNLLLARSQSYERIKKLRAKIKEILIFISEDKQEIEQLSKEIAEVEGTEI